jgi:hypothetical protein
VDRSNGRTVERGRNITQRGVQRRLITGIVWLIIGVAGTALLIYFDAPRAWRLALLLPLGLASNGILQARAKT